jgi:NADP-dependent 3-hydroxy acid dehydrogenase YdfG
MRRKDALFLKGKTILVYGATGGIGRAVAAEFQAAGARVIAGGRNRDALERLGRELRLADEPFCADFTDEDDLDRAGARFFKTNDRLDILVITAGRDVRRLFHRQTPQEIRETIAVNLTGPTLLVHRLLPVFLDQDDGAVAVVGGYGDGRLAFPCHAADAAARAGVNTLFAGISREHPESKLRFLYYCPPAVRTETEAPFLPLWRELGVKIISPGAAADELARALRRGKAWHMVGTMLDRFGVRLNAVRPALANRLFLKGMGKKIINYINRMEEN